MGEPFSFRFNIDFIVPCHSAKEDKPATDGVTDILTKKRALWGCIDKSLFFDALLEVGSINIYFEP